MTTETLISIVLLMLVIALALVRVRGLLLTYPHSLNPVKAYRERRDVIDSVRADYPKHFGKRK